MVSLTIPTPKDFRFDSTMKTHGWYQLAPYIYDEETGWLTRRVRLRDNTIVDIVMRAAKANNIQIHVHSNRVLTSRQRYYISLALRNMFNLHINLNDFYKTMRKTEGYEWVDEHKTGRMLASPTVWEDLAKTLMTTNIAWSGTVQMAKKTVALDPAGAFPTPEMIASYDEDELAKKTGMGYRAAYLHELASRITNMELDVERLRNVSSEEFYDVVMGIKGFGEYSAGTMLRLYGHFDKLPIDTVARNAYEQVTGKAPKDDKDIHKYYEDYGDWRSLVLWMDCIRDDYVAEPEPEKE